MPKVIILEVPQMKKGGWIKGAVNPAHKGYCTPMSKSTCTPRRAAFAGRAKAHFMEDGGMNYGPPYLGSSTYPNYSEDYLNFMAQGQDLVATIANTRLSSEANTVPLAASNPQMSTSTPQYRKPFRFNPNDPWSNNPGNSRINPNYDTPGMSGVPSYTSGQDPWYSAAMSGIPNSGIGGTSNNTNTVSSGTNFGTQVGKYLPYAQAAYLGARWLFDKPETQKVQRVPNVNPNLIPENTGQQEIQDAYNSGYYNLKNSGQYSPYGQTAMMTQRAKADYQRRLQLATINAGIKNQTQAENTGINQYNSRMNWEEQNANAANRSAKRNAGDKFFTSLGNIGQENRQNEFYKKWLERYYPETKNIG